MFQKCVKNVAANVSKMCQKNVAAKMWQKCAKNMATMCQNVTENVSKMCQNCSGKCGKKRGKNVAALQVPEFFKRTVL
jgi:hypothetical protein